jgi:hypothetical protein
MEDWFKARPADERARRHEFKKEFKPHYDGFRELPLSTARNISEHRGVARVTVTISGRFALAALASGVDILGPFMDGNAILNLAKASIGADGGVCDVA